MTINSNRVRSLLLLLLVAQVINLGIFLGLDYTQEKLGNWIFSQTAKPFLASTLQASPAYKNSTQSGKSAVSSVKTPTKPLK